MPRATIPPPQRNSRASVSDPSIGFQEIDGGEDELRDEFSCPFCYEDFDVIDLCCHVDNEHPVESKNGVCPLCEARVGMDIVGHIIMKHGSIYKVQGRRRLRKGSPGSPSVLSFLWKELRDGNLQSLPEGSSFKAAARPVEPDPFLSPLIFTLPTSDLPKDAESGHFDQRNLTCMNLIEKVEERPSCPEPCLSDEEQKERIRRSKFTQGLMLSTLFEDP